MSASSSWKFSACQSVRVEDILTKYVTALLAFTVYIRWTFVTGNKFNYIHVSGWDYFVGFHCSSLTFCNVYPLDICHGERISLHMYICA